LAKKQAKCAKKVGKAGKNALKMVGKAGKMTMEPRVARKLAFALPRRTSHV
jgi:hypothetical protein